MEDTPEKIVIYESFDTVMQANLAKTKLDAYGIPCFLTEENFTGFFPLRNEIFPGVRLHVFEMDQDRVKEVLADVPPDVELTLCPHCHSTNVTIEESKDADSRDILVQMLFVMMPSKKVNYCNDCEREWD